MFRSPRLLTVLCLFLVIAACGSGDEGQAEESIECGDESVNQGKEIAYLLSNPNDAEMCANVAGGVEEANRPSLGIKLDRFSHACKFHLDLLLTNGDFEPDEYGLEAATAIDLFLNPADISDEDLEEAEDVISTFGEGGIRVLKLQGIDESDISEEQVEEAATVLFDLIDQIRQDKKVAVSPHYLLEPAPIWKYGPFDVATRLTDTTGFSQLATTGFVTDAGRVVVIDTGAVGGSGDVGLALAEDPADVLRVPGHGVFVASVVKQYNPRLDVELYRAAFKDGTLSEASVAAALLRAGDYQEDDVVNLSLGTYPCGDDYDPLGLATVLDKPVIVAAAGNDGSAQAAHSAMYPASVSSVIGVGALGLDWKEAIWSSQGDVWAPGEGIVGWYHDGDEGGLAYWSGTSFAAPHRAACIASGGCAGP